MITADRRVATLAFGIRLMGLSAQQQLIDGMRSRLRPPAGVSAQLVGLPVLAAKSGAEVASPWRRLLTLIVGLIAVALVLLIAFRGDRRRTLVPLAPIVLATGWSALVLFVVRVPLNPMSVTLGALVIAISTEFSVLLSERYRQERIAGHDTVEALRRSYRRTGAAVAASGVTAIVGFGVLALSDIRMLRDFGLVTLIDLSVSLIGVLVALPAAIMLAERSEPLALRRRRRGRVNASRAPRPTSPTVRSRARWAVPPPARPRPARMRERWRAALCPEAVRVRVMSTPEPAAPPHYGRYVGLLALVIVALITVNTIVTKPNGDKGIEPGHPLPPFAVPLALGNVVGDADIASGADQGAAGRVPACQERGAQILNVCQLYERGPVVLALFIDSGSCPAVVSDLQALVPSFPGVQFAAVAIKGERAALRRLVRTRGLSLPVGVDRDGALGRAVQGRDLSAGDVRLSRRDRPEQRDPGPAGAGDAARAGQRAPGRVASARLEGVSR